jgi:type I restriction enzyme S subunit
MNAQFIQQEQEYKETELGLLPKDWEVRKLSDFAEVKYGKSNPRDIGSIPVVGSSGVFSHTSKPLTDFPTIVIGRKGNAGKVWLFLEPCFPSDTTFYLEWKEKVDVKYIFEYLTSKPLSGEHAKTTVPSLTRPDLENQKVPFPQTHEQQKIVFVLSKIQNAKEKTGAVINSLKELKKALMKHLFTYGAVSLEDAEKIQKKETEIGMIPEGWKETRVKNYCKQILTGGTPRTEIKEYYQPAEIPWMKSGEIQGNRIRRINTFISKKGLENSNAKMLPKNSVVIALAGRGKTRGTTSILDIECTCNQSVVCMVPNDDMVAEFLHYYLANMYTYIRNLTGDKDRTGLNKEIVGNLPLFLPNKSEQGQIASILSSVDSKTEAEERKEEALDELFKSMLYNLMSAKIRVNHLGAS